MRQQTFASQARHQKYDRKSLCELSTDEMGRAVPWSGLLAQVRPHSVKQETGGCPRGLEIIFCAVMVEPLRPGCAGALV